MTHKVRVVTIDRKPWFVAADVARVLGLDTAVVGRTAQADEKGLHTVLTPGGPQKMTAITEAGLYRLIMLSRKPVARPFQDWVTREVLPAIRQTGGYMLAGADRSVIREGASEVMPLPRTMGEALRQHAETLIKLADEQEAHARTEAERKAAVEAKAQAEAELARVQPHIKVGEMACKHEHTLSRFVRASCKGAHKNAIKGDLLRLGYLYRTSYNGTYRVYAKYEDLFVERIENQWGKVEIFPTAKGRELILDLYLKGELTMRKGCTPTKVLEVA